MYQIYKMWILFPKVPYTRAFLFMIHERKKMHTFEGFDLNGPLYLYSVINNMYPKLNLPSFYYFFV